MGQRILMPWFIVCVLAVGASTKQPTVTSGGIDLKGIGYSQDVCSYEGKARIEFLDSLRLLLSFPLHSAPCSGQSPQKWRAAVVDASGKTLNTLDLEPGQGVRAAPEGRILLLTDKELRILNYDFIAVQTLSWPKEADPSQIPHGAWVWATMTSIELTPSRQGFVIRGPYPKYGAAYFEGNPVKQTAEVDSCSQDFVVTDGGFACLDPSTPVRLVVHPMNDVWHLDDSLFQKREWVALPTPDRVLLLTNKFQLSRFIRPGNAEKVADLHWLAPWLGYPRMSYALTSGATHRILVSSWGARIPLSDSSGIGYWKRVVILDYLSGQIIFRQQFKIDSDFAISPDGHLLAVLEKSRLSVVALP